MGKVIFSGEVRIGLQWRRGTDLLEEMLDALRVGVNQLWAHKDAANAKWIFITNLHSGS